MEQSYKEKYEQAIERLKQWDREHPCGGYVVSDRDKFIFPELAESEGEKVRKELIKHLKELSDWKEDEVIPVKNPSYYRQWASWLEKQGQVKESFISQHENKTCKENDDSLTSEDDRIREALVEMVHDTTGDELWIDYNVHKEEALDWLERQGEHANFRNKIQVGDKVTRNEDGVLVNLSQLKRVAKPREKQCEQKFEMKSAEENLGIGSNTYNKIVDECIFGEQKPADKVEPKFKVGDKIYLKPEYRMPNDDTPIANTVKEIRRIDDKHYRFDGSYIFIEDQDKYALVEQKPSEQQMYWTEEEIEPIISDYLCGREHYGGMIGRLCHLKPKQKQTEWGEDDKAFLDDILCKLEHDLILNKDEKDWLKSLRPQNHWKPTDEQMGCLSDAIEHYNSLGYPASKLKELLDDLKKIKGEV